jgi:hypothetical protein
MASLRDYLLDAYGGYADRRIRDRSLDRAIKIDDKGPHDVYPRFCTISARVPDPTGETLILTLQNCPAGQEVLELAEKFAGSVHATDFGLTITLTLKASQGPAIRRLAKAIRAIVGRGRTYDNPNLRWICPRTAAALEQLAEHLAMYREERWPGEPRSPDPMLARRRGAFVASPTEWQRRTIPVTAKGPVPPGSDMPGRA